MQLRQALPRVSREAAGRMARMLWQHAAREPAGVLTRQIDQPFQLRRTAGTGASRHWPNRQNDSSVRTGVGNKNQNWRAYRVRPGR